MLGPLALLSPPWGDGDSGTPCLHPSLTDHKQVYGQPALGAPRRARESERERERKRERERERKREREKEREREGFFGG